MSEKIVHRNLETDPRFACLVAGRQHSGKTWYINRFADGYARGLAAANGKPAKPARGGCLIYNYGKISDWPNSLEVRFLEPTETAFIDYPIEQKELKFARQKFLAMPEIRYFQIVSGGGPHNGKFYKIEKFREGFLFKKVRVRRMDAKFEELLYRFIYQYLSDFLIIFDDCKPLFRHGLLKWALAMTSQKRHAGELLPVGSNGFQQGIDLFFVFHGLEPVNPIFYDYCNELLLFRMNSAGMKKGVENPQLEKLVWKVWQENQKPVTGRPDFPGIKIFLDKPGMPCIKI